MVISKHTTSHNADGKLEDFEKTIRIITLLVLSYLSIIVVDMQSLPMARN